MKRQDYGTPNLTVIRLPIQDCIVTSGIFGTGGATDSGEDDFFE